MTGGLIAESIPSGVSCIEVCLLVELAVTFFFFLGSPSFGRWLVLACSAGLTINRLPLGAALTWASFGKMHPKNEMK